MALRRALVIYKSARRFGIKKEKPNRHKVVRFRFLLVELSGFEPLASSLRTRRSTN